MVGIDTNIFSHINMQELSNVVIVVKLYDRIVEEGELVAPKCQKQDYVNLNVCMWHFSSLHSTNQCKSFKGFIKKMRTDGLVISKQEYQTLDLANFQPRGKKVEYDHGQSNDAKTRTNHDVKKSQKA